jgi:hypothetical protein
MSRLKEIAKIALVGVMGAVLMFAIQPLIFSTPLAPLRSVNRVEWVKNNYPPGATIIFLACLIATIIWYCLALVLSQKAHTNESLKNMTWVWVTFFLVPIAGLATWSLYEYAKTSYEALPALIIFWVLDVFLIFWLGTAISSPGSFQNVVPLSEILRKWWGG